MNKFIYRKTKKKRQQVDEKQQVEEALALFQSTLANMDMSLQYILPDRSYIQDDAMPDGIVYEDIMAELMKIFKLCYAGCRGQNSLGQSEDDKQNCKDQLR